MLTLNVFFDVKEENKQEFLSLLNNMVVESNKEVGCSYYHLLQDLVQKNRYTLIEHWDSEEALNSHNKTTHWIYFNDTVNNYLSTQYEEHHYMEIQ
ncbi:TPA: antibiotic biosynthesis monooxygenase [Enterococcus faecalis]|nr:antibiotic biosynthesis monooxygenase [Enterococcus faecalis]HAP3815347.1 antibiotic biosynthesis monooxygenase [Enterococcus faecalis]